MTTALVFTRDNVRAAEYALPSVVGFVSGILINKLGPKYTLLVGCVGYPVKIAAYLSNDGLYRRCYVGSEDCYSRFEEFAGILLAFCQGLSGSVVPYLMLVYPTANSKGLAVAGFLGLWSLSALVGAAVSILADSSCISMAAADIGDRSSSFPSASRRRWRITAIFTQTLRSMPCGTLPSWSSRWSPHVSAWP